VWTMQDLSVDIWQSWSPGGGFSVHLEHLTPLPFCVERRPWKK
jgi:hypothetical protein